MKNGRARGSQIFPHYNPMGAIPEFWSDHAQNLIQPTPYPNDPLDGIWL